MTALPVARGDVIDDGVAPHMLERIGLADTFAALADHHGQLGLVVNRAGGGRHFDRGIRADDRLGHLAEINRKGRNIAA